MQEIAPHIYIETGYAGVTLGAINWPHGLILIDAPFRAEDARSWRSTLLNLSGGIDRILINMDSHLDRTLGVRAMECTVVGHENMIRVFRNRPVTFKAQTSDTGADWEQHNGLGSIRWAPPEITFTDQLNVHWDSGSPLYLQNRPGPTGDAIWAVLPEQGIVFIGDCVVAGRPPFLAGADLEEWRKNLAVLASPEYHNYLMISGRSGLVSQNDVHRQAQLLEKIHAQLEELAAAGAAPEETEKLVPALLAGFNPP
ncbi:MAG: hypothetical protein GYA17_19185, partial [Chloroflexi bacterium]|nr:hypothetical protein [Chloroflexota bacterium]